MDGNLVVDATEPQIVSRVSAKRRRNNVVAFLFLLPTLAMILVFNYYPAISAFFYSFTAWDGFTQPHFIGFQNFVEMLTTQEFSVAFLNLLWLTLAAVVISLTIPLIVAEFIYKVVSQRSQNFYRMMFVIPMVVPSMVILLLWQFILNPDVGLLNAILQVFGVPTNEQPLWLASPNTALLSLILIGFPWVSGVSVLIYLAGFQAIPGSVIESARVDGATGWRLFFQIELPLVFSQIKLILVLTIINALQAFQTQLVLTQGGPGYATTVPGLVMYQEAMQDNRLGFGCAIGVVLFVLIFALTVINNRYFKSSTEYAAD